MVAGDVLGQCRPTVQTKPSSAIWSVSRIEGSELLYGLTAS